ncbi:MAG: ribonucleotide-diphosphate reductase subunit beta, partial [Stenotrophomonas sp.]
MATPLERIKILEPRYPNRSTGIINGRTSGILNWNDIPYPSFYRAYKELSTNFWIPDEVDMKGDARQYGELSAREKNAYDSIIGLLATLDSPQTRFIYNVAEYITDPAAHANAAIIGQQEVIHNESYSYVLASIAGLADQNRVFELARTHPTILARNAPIMQ